MDFSRKNIARFYLYLSRRGKRWIFRGLDCVIIGLSIYLAFSLRFDLFSMGQNFFPYIGILYLLFPIKLVCFWFVGLYRPVIRYVGFEFLTTAMIAVLSSTGLLATSAFLFRLNPFPRSVFILDGLLTLVFIIAARVLVRWIVYQSITMPDESNSPERVLVYGAGAAGCQLAHALSREEKYKVIAFVDDNRQLQKQNIGGLKVYSRSEIKKLIGKYNIESILLAIPSATRQENLEIVQNLQYFGVQIKTVPGIGEIISGKFSISKIRKIDITDLLGRAEVQSIPELLEQNILNQTVLVTGAGGSIGSELCRQISRYCPKRLILYERNEFALYTIDIELRETFPDIETIARLSSVTEQERLEKVLVEFQVDTIYHAAAYKHVPLVEENLTEGIYNNVYGTLSCVQAAINCCVNTFVLISTDKAVRPTNVMGTTKRIAELILQAFSERRGSTTRFVMVRFGNVLNSTGSVVPRFRQQIAKGEDITVTHKDITRYFMSIPEAAKLVIQAGAMGKGGDVFLLDMGEPVKIYDLAKQMIELSGLQLGKDMDIKVTGLRPGEKLYEELLIDKNKNTPTKHPKVFCAEEHSIPWKTLSPKLNYLLTISKNGSRDEIIQSLQAIVPEFTPDSRGTLSKGAAEEMFKAENRTNVIPFSQKKSVN